MHPSDVAFSKNDHVSPAQEMSNTHFSDGDFFDGNFSDGDFADSDFSEGDFSDGDFSNSVIQKDGRSILQACRRQIKIYPKQNLEAQVTFERRHHPNIKKNLSWKTNILSC